MERIEKVIKGLECCTEDGCKDCPYYNNCDIFDEYPSETLLKDVLEVLKEQEPRVLTWDEVEHAEVCWVEERGNEPYADLDAADWNPEYYGKTIRCWNYKPTKEQRKAVKWNETD